MSARSVVNVDFIAEYKGRQNLNKAHSDVANLTAGLKRLAGAFGLAFGVTAIARFGKASVQAFATNQKQVALLTNTLKNLGQSFAALSTNKFIDTLSLASGKTKEELIPAFQRLFIATGDAVKAQDALKLAMDVSAGTGNDLDKVTRALSKAYLGNYVGLTKLGAGLSKTILATKDMKLITAELARVTRGDAATAADTLQGKMDRLKVAFTEAEVAIGSGLVTAFGNLAGSTDFNSALEKIVKFGAAIGTLVDDLSSVAKYLGAVLFAFHSMPTTFDKNFKKVNDELMAAKVAYEKTKANPSDLMSHNAVAAQAVLIAKAKLKISEADAKAAAASAKAAKDKLATERAALSLKLAGSTVDMQNIEIQAALQRGQSKEVTNVLLLQRALLNGNADQATILSQEVLKANGLVMDVDGNISALKDAKDPFKGWPTASAEAIKQIASIQAALDALRDKTIKIQIEYFAGNAPVIIPPGGGPPPVVQPPVVIPPSGGGEPPPVVIPTGQTGNGPDASYDQAHIPLVTGQTGNGPDASYDQAHPVVINITAPANTVVDTTQTASTNGTAVTVNRVDPFGMYNAI